jgi:hypothetical protein
MSLKTALSQPENATALIQFLLISRKKGKKESKAKKESKNHLCHIWMLLGRFPVREISK